MEGKMIRYFRKNVWGNDLYYPVDCAMEIEALTGKKTLVSRTFEAFERMGVKFIEVLESSIKQEVTR